MKTTNLLFIIAGILIVILIGGSMYLLTQDYFVQTIPIVVPVGDYAGVNVETGNLTFGTLQPGMRGERSITLRVDEPTIIHIRITGIDFVHAATASLSVDAETPHHLTIRAQPPDDTPHGIYEGVLHLIHAPAR